MSPLKILLTTRAGRTTITIAHRLSTIKDADVIYVMGEGLVLEHGSHDDLISRDGAYARLVQAQKLRESGDVSASDPAAAGEEAENMEKVAREEVPLGRKNTGHSLASEILEQKRQAAGADKEDKAHGLFYLFKRMGKLNREGWSSYFWGSIFAASKSLLLHNLSHHGLLT